MLEQLLLSCREAALRLILLPGFLYEPQQALKYPQQQSPVAATLLRSGG